MGYDSEISCPSVTTFPLAKRNVVLPSSAFTIHKMGPCFQHGVFVPAAFFVKKTYQDSPLSCCLFVYSITLEQ
jgi:hypothetical protein